MAEDNRHLTFDEIIEITKGCVGKTFGDLGMNRINKAHKGGIGAFVEEHVFNYSANSDNHPDFIDAGLELKVTPVKINKNGSYSSKERLVLNMINYVDEVNKTFETSSFYTKNKNILVIFYLWSKGENPENYKVTNYDVFKFENSQEFNIIKNDRQIIHNKIERGLAHLISESDTTFLSACTKGANSKILTSQPRSDIKAKPRAYSFKAGFMTRIYRKLIHEIAPYNSFISDDEWTKNSLEEIYKDKLSKYYGKSVKELKRIFHINNNPKQLTFTLAQRMLGINGKASGTQEMIDAGIKLKAVNILPSGTPAQDMSFKAFDFTELMNTPWEESSIREDFIDWKLMIFVYKTNDKGVCRFDKILFWNIPNILVDSKIKELYLKCVDVLKTGNIIRGYNKRGNRMDNFPKTSAERGGNGICHVRPHGIDADDTFPLPVPDRLTGITEYTKQCFWFNKLFIKKIINELENEEGVNDSSFDVLYI